MLLDLLYLTMGAKSLVKSGMAVLVMLRMAFKVEPQDNDIGRE